MWFKVHVGSVCRCTAIDCRAALRRSSEAYIDAKGTVVCVACYAERYAGKPADGAEACLICNDKFARPGRQTCSRKCEYRLRRQNKSHAQASAELTDANA